MTWYMGNFNRRGSSDRGPKTFAKKNFGGRSFEAGNKPQMYDATCSSCGKDCKVPFRPTGSRPIFCSICFDRQGDEGAPRSSEKNFDRPRFGDKRKRDFDKETVALDHKNAEHLKAEFARIHAKLDMIVQALEIRTLSKRQEAELAEAGENGEVEKAPFKMAKKVSSGRKSTKKK